MGRLARGSRRQHEASPQVSHRRRHGCPSRLRLLEHRDDRPGHFPLHHRPAGGSLGEPRGTGGTTTDYPLNLRNTSTSTCTVQGYAGVSFVAGDDNHQIGHAASRDTGSAPTITLSHGQTASATLGIVDAANFPPDCDPTSPTGLRVSPPDQTAWLVIDPAGIACSNPKYTPLHVGPFESA